MQKILILFVLIGTLLFITPVAAEEVDQNTLEAVMQAIQLDKQLEEIKTMTYVALAGLLPHTLSLHKDNPETLRALVYEAFALEKLRPLFTREFAYIASSAQIELMAQWLGSEPGSRIAANQAEVMLPVNIKTGVDYKEAFDPERQKLINLIRSMLRNSREHMEMQMTFYAGVIISSYRAKGKPGRDFHKVLNGIRFDKSTLVDVHEQVMLHVIPYIYRNITDEELKQYIAFCRSDVGKKMQAAVDQSFAKVVETAFLELIETLEKRRGLRRFAVLEDIVPVHVFVGAGDNIGQCFVNIG